jgi:hypothetical protein
MGKGDVHITHSDHTNSLPNAQPNSRYNTSVQALDPILRVDVPERGAHSHLRWSVRIHRLALHLDSNDLDRLVPGTESTTQSRCQDLLPRAQWPALGLAGHLADALLCQTRQAESGAPVGHLADGNSVDSFVDSADALLAVDVHECGKCAWGLDACLCELGLRDLDCLHAGAESHSGVCLCNSSQYSSADSCCEIAGAEGSGVVFAFGGYEEEDGSLGGGFDPGPWDKTLVDCLGSMMVRRGSFCCECARKGSLQPRTPPLPQIRPRAPANESPRFAAIVVFVTSRG